MKTIIDISWSKPVDGVYQVHGWVSKEIEVTMDELVDYVVSEELNLVTDEHQRLIRVNAYNYLEDNLVEIIEKYFRSKS